MPRKPIGKIAMTSTERSRRRRARLQLAAKIDAQEKRARQRRWGLPAAWPHEPGDVIIRRFRIERGFEGGLNRLYLDVPGRRKDERRWRLVWTAKQAFYHCDIRKVLQIRFVSLDASASCDEQDQRHAGNGGPRLALLDRRGGKS